MMLLLVHTWMKNTSYRIWKIFLVASVFGTIIKQLKLMLMLIVPDPN